MTPLEASAAGLDAFGLVIAPRLASVGALRGSRNGQWSIFWAGFFPQG